eukprot:TRINITY_DN19740_c0_g1_i1.p2 TRINITY_DN19740_c0_g1~~TRINITY_DN19740_c0_g1_i1.p2  ORF type:complete len:255 (-),score=28.56 TRINITY_DN19740_c0_g1_i1:31-795(-)
MSSTHNAIKFSARVSDCPQLDPAKMDKFKRKYLDYTYLEHDSEEGKLRMRTLENVIDLQYKRWEWAQGNQWKYINALRLAQFSDENIQDMCNARRPLCFPSAALYEEFCASLGELAERVEKEMGWRNVRFVQTGSSVVGFSTNPLKGVADRPTRITSVEKSDLDVVIVAEMGDFLGGEGEKKEYLGHRYPTTRARGESGTRVGCKPSRCGEAIKEWAAVWSAKMGGGIQLTFDTDPNPSIPPWESWVPIPHKAN